MAAPTAEKDQVESAAEDYSSSVEEAQPVTRSSKKSRKSSKAPKKKSRKASSALEQVPGTGGVENTANQLGSGVTNTMGSVANTALENQGKAKEEGGGGGGGGSDTLRLRLDLNLDIEIQLKARIHGDLELALLN